MNRTYALALSIIGSLLGVFVKGQIPVGRAVRVE